MPKRKVKVSSFYISDGASAAAPPILTAEPPHGALSFLSGDFAGTLPCEAKVKRNRFRPIEDVMDSTGLKVKSQHFRSIEDVMNSTGRNVKENHFRTIEDIMNSTWRKVKENNVRSIVDIMSSSGPINKATEDGALMSYEENFGKIVPYEGRVKTKPFRAKVDKGKEICLDEETKIYRERIDLFRAAMRMVQGPWSYPPWGGSVVSSVIGVLLTQNVSDHLSSSAFMSLAAKFPTKSRVYGKPSNRMLPATSGVDGDWSELPTYSTDDSVGTNMHMPTYMQLLFMQEENASKNETRVIEPLTTPHPSVPTLEYQSKDTEKVLTEAHVYGSKTKKARGRASKKKIYDFEAKRKDVINSLKYRESVQSVHEILDLEAIRHADVSEIAEIIKKRGMNTILGQRIKDFLNMLVSTHGSMDLEWLHHVDEETAEAYLLSIKGLGLKSVECVRLLTLHHKAFPVDTNVGRICVRLGWVPLQPLPESLLLHLLELYPVLDNIHKYLWPRLCNLDHETLYELHYEMITFGKVFCTKTKPNCKACPLRAECRHFASKFSSARIALPGSGEKSSVSLGTPFAVESRHQSYMSYTYGELLEWWKKHASGLFLDNDQPIIEEPASPKPGQEIERRDMEDYLPYDSEGINEFTQIIKNYLQLLNTLASMTNEAASISTPEFKNVSRLRTEHQVYELPDNSPLLEGFDKREPDSTCPYLLCIWNPGGTAQSSDTPKVACKCQDRAQLCESNACFQCNITRGSQDQKIRGTILARQLYQICAIEKTYCKGIRWIEVEQEIPCRDAMRGIFPLGGTYFQVNEVFADHASSQNPIVFPREWIDERASRTVFFGTSVPTIYKDLEIEKTEVCFRRGAVCVRAFDRASGAPRPLNAMFHLPPGKRSIKGKMSPAGHGTTVEKKKFISVVPDKLPASPAGHGTTVEKKKFISVVPDKLPAKKKRRSSLQLGS